MLRYCLKIIVNMSEYSDDSRRAAEQEQRAPDVYGGYTGTYSKTELPKLWFEGDISGMAAKTDERRISLRYENGDDSFACYGKLRIQGTSSLGYDKKNYNITFYQDEDLEHKQGVDLGWGEQSKYCLKANWIDRTQARNVVTARLASQIQEKYGVLTEAPCNGLIDGFPVEIYSNGEFLGLYTCNIPKDTWQFGMDEDDPNHIVICGEGWEATNLFMDLPDFEAWSVEVGEENEQTLEKMNSLFRFVINSSNREFVQKFEEYIDLDAALTYYIMSDVAYLRDNQGKNMLLVTYDGKKWYPSLYDLDTSWGTFFDVSKEYDYDAATLTPGINFLFFRLETHYSQELSRRYFELRETILSREHILAEFDAFRAAIPEGAFEREATRWQNIPGYEYGQIRHYLDVVLPALDAKYAQMQK